MKIFAKEGFQLLFLSLRIKLFAIVDGFYSLCFYSSPTFRRLDWEMWKSSFFSSPFRVSRNFYAARAEPSHQYGETPLCTAAFIAKRCALKKGQSLYELGAGRGRLAFWWAWVWGLRVTAIERIPFFVKEAESLRKKQSLPQPRFVCGDFCDQDYVGADAVFVYTTFLSEVEMSRLGGALQSLNPGAKLISISSAFEIDGFVLEDSFEASFPWGRGEVFLQIKTGES